MERWLRSNPGGPEKDLHRRIGGKYGGTMLNLVDVFTMVFQPDWHIERKKHDDVNKTRNPRANATGRSDAGHEDDNSDRRSQNGQNTNRCCWFHKPIHQTNDRTALGNPQHVRQHVLPRTSLDGSKGRRNKASVKVPNKIYKATKRGQVE